MKTICLQVLRYVLIAGAVAAAVQLLILVRADQLFHRDTAVSIAAAVHLQPHNSEYISRLASWQPDDRQNLLRRAIRENPFDDNDLIRLGFLAEMQDGDAVAAERYYRQAAKVNLMFLPRWTLTNFYFRQQRPREFFHWSRETLAITPYASDSVFAQMRLMTNDEDLIQAAIPDRPRILLQYAWYLANANNFVAVPRAVSRLLHAVGSGNPAEWGRNDMLASVQDRMLEAGSFKPALEVWSSMHQAGWVASPAPSTAHPLTNGDFRSLFYSHGFDWVTVQNTGTRVEQIPEANSLRVELFGDEAEHVTLVHQFVPLAPGRKYAMSWDVTANDLAEPSGIAWHLRPVKSDSVAARESGGLLANPQTWEFSAGAPLNQLTLEYNRPIGVTRSHGSFTIKSVSLSSQ